MAYPLTKGLPPPLWKPSYVIVAFWRTSKHGKVTDIKGEGVENGLVLRESVIKGEGVENEVVQGRSKVMSWNH